MRYFSAASELEVLYDLSTQCEGRSYGRDAVWKIAPVFVSIPYTDGCIYSLGSFHKRLRQELPILADHGERRAKRAYQSLKDTITKPSYIKRLVGSYPGVDGSQFDSLISTFIKEPDSGGLVFSIFHPKDINDKFRPGYVPCLVSGSLVYIDGKIQINAFFRSQSILEFGSQDLYFLRQFQRDFVASVDAVPRDMYPKRSCPTKIEAGDLNIHFGRIVIPSRLARSKSSSLYRRDIYDLWRECLVSVMEEEECV